MTSNCRNLIFRTAGTIILLAFLDALLTRSSVSGQTKPAADTMIASLVGHWTYRSFLNRAAHEDDINKLLFAEAELVFDKISSGKISGVLNMGGAGSLTIDGTVTEGTTISIRFKGVGKSAGSPSEGWIYDYIGWYVPPWPNGIDQKPAIVGSVIRTVPHSNGQAKAGVVASFIAVKRD